MQTAVPCWLAREKRAKEICVASISFVTTARMHELTQSTDKWMDSPAKGHSIFCNEAPANGTRPSSIVWPFPKSERINQKETISVPLQIARRSSHLGLAFILPTNVVMKVALQLNGPKQDCSVKRNYSIRLVIWKLELSYWLIGYRRYITLQSIFYHSRVAAQKQQQSVSGCNVSLAPAAAKEGKFFRSTGSVVFLQCGQSHKIHWPSRCRHAIKINWRTGLVENQSSLIAGCLSLVFLFNQRCHIFVA